MIVTRGLTKRFGRHVAVDALTMSLQGPGVIGFLGPNGAGKTTTLRMLTGVLASTDGTVTVGGFDVFDQPRQARARVGYLAERPAWSPALTVGETLRYAAELHGLRRADRMRAVGNAMERVGLRGMEQRPIATLAGGMRKRVGLAQALVHGPDVLILDEPTTGLDPIHIREIRTLVQELARERLVVLSSHLLPQVEAICDTVLLMNEGRRLAQGTVAELAAQVGATSHVELALDGPDEDVSARIAGVEAVQGVRRVRPGHYDVTGSDAVEPALAALAGVRGWKIRRLARSAPSLEDVFVALVEQA